MRRQGLVDLVRELCREAEFFYAHSQTTQKGTLQTIRMEGSTMKQKLVWISAVTAAALLTAACGTQSASNTAKDHSTAKPTTPSSTGGSTTVHYPLTLTDDAGHKLTLAKQPQHIVSATEGTDEILTALVPKKRIAMVTSQASNPNYSNVRAQVKGIPAISDAASDVEKILAAKPDLVLLASYTKPGAVQQIEQASVPAYEFNNFNSIADIERNIGVVGKLVGEPAKANRLVSAMKQNLSGIHQAVKNEKKLSVLDYSSYGFAAGNQTTVNDMIVDAGGINAAAKLNGWAKVTDEEIVKMNPDVIIDSSDDKAFIQKILHDPKLQTVSAVKNHRVYAINGADLSSVSQYVVKGVWDVAHAMYPDANLPQVTLPTP
ncbi:ABC transporter substrate-binding protein [Alicyclobacillus herbarius]|uniref:ABC transporter substrate-binding protein n=1 Tax=Alicyclobacillus herbarius TaxID=122960 RepID=UPI002354845B|nr:ABC transporter substrate-binding protein [Alicyclobacillus herbarius]